MSEGDLVYTDEIIPIMADILKTALSGDGSAFQKAMDDFETGYPELHSEFVKKAVVSSDESVNREYLETGPTAADVPPAEDRSDVVFGGAKTPVIDPAPKAAKYRKSGEQIIKLFASEPEIVQSAGPINIETLRAYATLYKAMRPKSPLEGTVDPTPHRCPSCGGKPCSCPGKEKQ